MWSRSDILQLIGIIISSVIAIGVYGLQKRLTEKQRVDNRLAIEEAVKGKLYDIRHNHGSRKVQLYNSRLLNKKYFTRNSRSLIWGYPFHAAELYMADFDGLEFITGIKDINKKKYYEIGVIPYENIIGVRPEGDGSFHGMVIYVKPKLLQLDKYSIAYKARRLYLIEKK